MKTRNLILTGLAIAASFVATGFQLNSVAACAQQRPGGHEPPPPPPPGQHGPGGPRGEDPMFRELNLTDAQKQQIKTLREKQRTDSESYHEQLREIGEQMRPLVEAASFDEAAVRALLAKEAQLETELKLIRIRTDNAVFNVLTAEQKAKLDELRRNHMPPPRPGN